MTLIAEYFVEGNPIPYNGTKARKGGGRYVPAEVRAWQENVATATRQAMAGREPSAGRISLQLDYYLPTYAKKDLDNCTKAVMDAIKGIAFDDDDQVTDLRQTKVYCPETIEEEYPDGLPPGVLVTIEELTPIHRKRQTRQQYYQNHKRRNHAQ